MNYPALLHAFKEVGRSILIALALTVPLVLAMWLPTKLLIAYAGMSFIEAYSYGVPLGLIAMSLGYIGYMAYRRKAREQ